MTEGIVIPGQIIAERILNQNLKGQIVSHAYLFEGPSGTGKEETALHFACAVNGEENHQKESRMALIKKIKSGVHPDMRLFHAEEASIRIGQMRELRREFQIRPKEKQWKIFVISDAEKMTMAAANSLLKVLEEPPRFGMIILVTQHLSQILPTIRSRCQIVPFRPQTQEFIRKSLIDNYQKSDEEALLISALSEGLPAKAAKMAEDASFEQQREEVFLDFEKVKSGGKKEIVFLIREYEKKKDIHDKMRWWMSIFRDILIWKKTQRKDLLLHPDKALVYEECLLWSDYHILGFLGSLDEADKKLQNNVNLGIVLQNTFVCLESIVS